MPDTRERPADRTGRSGQDGGGPSSRVVVQDNADDPQDPSVLAIADEILWELTDQEFDIHATAFLKRVDGQDIPVSRAEYVLRDDTDANHFLSYVWVIRVALRIGIETPTYAQLAALSTELGIGQFAKWMVDLKDEYDWVAEMESA